jgi:chromosome segregation ATPase
MSKLIQLDQLDRAIKDAEFRLKSVQDNIEKIYKEINTLEPRKTELENNLKFHKQSNTIPLAHEYRKAKIELNQVKSRLNLINLDQKRAIQACIDIEAIIEKFKRDRDQLLKTSDNNILRPRFGSTRGKK